MCLCQVIIPEKATAGDVLVLTKPLGTQVLPLPPCAPLPPLAAATTAATAASAACGLSVVQPTPTNAILPPTNWWVQVAVNLAEWLRDGADPKRMGNDRFAKVEGITTPEEAVTAYKVAERSMARWESAHVTCLYLRYHFPKHERFF